MSAAPAQARVRVRYDGGRADLFPPAWSELPAAVAELFVVDIGGPLGTDAAVRAALGRPPAGEAPTIVLAPREAPERRGPAASESALLAMNGPVIVFRCAPLDAGIELHRHWVEASGTLVSSYADEGVAWLAVVDLVDGILAAGAQVAERRGRRFDVTGPRRVPTAELALALGADPASPTTRLAAEDFSALLSRQGIDDRTARLLPLMQAGASSPRLPDTSLVLDGLLGRRPADPLAAIASAPAAGAGQARPGASQPHPFPTQRPDRTEPTP